MSLSALPHALQSQDFTYTTNNGTITITGYTGPGGVVSIPDTINGLPVGSIGVGAFARASVTSVSFGDGISSIGEGAFFRCQGLTNVSLGSGVTSVGFQAFTECFNLSVITVDALNRSFTSVDGILYDKSGIAFLLCPPGRTGSVTIPAGVTSIGPWACYDCRFLNGIVIPASVTSIAEHAFDYCTNLNSVTLPDSITKVGNWAFANCFSLTRVAIPDRVTSIGDYGFYVCNNLTNIVLGSGIAALGEAAFEFCYNLTGVYYEGNSPSEIFSNTFGAADSVTNYYLPGALGWESTFAGRPTAPWVLPYPVILDNSPSFGLSTNGFGFTVSWATNATVSVEACTNLLAPSWSSIATNTLVNGWSPFSDGTWSNSVSRFYRVRSL